MSFSGLLNHELALTTCKSSPPPPSSLLSLSLIEMAKDSIDGPVDFDSEKQYNKVSLCRAFVLVDKEA